MMLLLMKPCHSSQCSVVSAADGRWRVSDCSAKHPTACRADSAPTNSPGDGPHSELVPRLGRTGDQPLWVFSRGLRGSCPADYSHAVPRTAKENMYLQIALAATRQSAAWLPVQGPAWALP